MSPQINTVPFKLEWLWSCLLLTIFASNKGRWVTSIKSNMCFPIKWSWCWILFEPDKILTAIWFDRLIRQLSWVVMTAWFWGKYLEIGRLLDWSKWFELFVFIVVVVVVIVLTLVGKRVEELLGYNGESRVLRWRRLNEFRLWKEVDLLTAVIGSLSSGVTGLEEPLE